MNSQRVRAEPGHQTMLVHSVVRSGLSMSVDSSVENVHRRRTSIINHKVDQTFGAVGHPNLKFWGIRWLRHCVVLLHIEECSRGSARVDWCVFSRVLQGSGSGTILPDYRGKTAGAGQHEFFALEDRSCKLAEDSVTVDGLLLLRGLNLLLIDEL